MARQKLKEYYKPEELTPELLAGLVDETEYRPRAILNFVEPVGHSDEQIRQEILIQQVDRFANIVGFSDSSIKTEGVRTTTRFIDPFHVKNYHEFKSTDSRFLQRSGDGWQISADGVRQSTTMQEDRRLNLLHWSFLSMLNDKQFSYADGDFMLTVPYSGDISDLTNPSAVLNDGNPPFERILAMKNEFLRAAGQPPDLAFMNAVTGGRFIEIPEVNAAFVAQQSSDPDESARMFEMFFWNGINWVILHEEYPDVSGTLQAPVDDNRMIMTVANVMDPNPDVAGLPFKMHRASNQLNTNDSSRPFYDMFEVSNDPAAFGHRLYDNWIPGVAKRNVVFHWNAVTS